MKLRTTQQLQAMFQASRERKQQEREEHKKQRQEQYQQLCKEADRLLKEDLERQKRQKMEQLQALAKQTSQNVRKWHITQSPTYIEDNLFDYIKVQSRNDIKKMEEEGDGKINWEVWDKLVKQTKKELKKMNIEIKDFYQVPRLNKRCTTTYVYDINHTLIGVYPKAKQAEDALNIRKNTVSYYKFLQKPYKNKYIFTDSPLS